MSVQYGEQRPHSWLQYGACSHETLQPGCQATCSIQRILSTLQWWLGGSALEVICIRYWGMPMRPLQARGISVENAESTATTGWEQHAEQVNACPPAVRRKHLRRAVCWCTHCCCRVVKVSRCFHAAQPHHHQLQSGHMQGGLESTKACSSVLLEPPRLVHLSGRGAQHPCKFHCHSLKHLVALHGQVIVDGHGSSMLGYCVVGLQEGTLLFM